MSRSRTLSKGRIVIMTAPSGAGKTTVFRRVREGMEDRLGFSVSHTTRPARAGEEHGRDYYFVDDAAFDAMVASGDFAEWAHVHKRRYGTSKAEVQRRLAQGLNVVLDVDVQGARSLRTVYPEALTIFILPPSLTELGRRLRGRGTETEEQLLTRLRTARDEVLDARDFRYVIVNEVVEDAALAFRSVLTSAPSADAKRHAHLQVLLKELAASEAPMRNERT